MGQEIILKCDRCKNEVEQPLIKRFGGLVLNKVFETQELLLCIKCKKDFKIFMGRN
jgi:DNA-directed RNA polymerase subunit RPC12/RpoP